MSRISYLIIVISIGFVFLGCAQISNSHDPIASNATDSTPEKIDQMTTDKQSLVETNSTVRCDKWDIFNFRIIHDPKPRFSAAISAADDALTQDPLIKPPQRNVLNYVLEVRDANDVLLIKYGPKDSARSKVDGSAETEAARDVVFIVRKTDNFVLGRCFFK